MSHITLRKTQSAKLTNNVELEYRTTHTDTGKGWSSMWSYLVLFTAFYIIATTLGLHSSSFSQMDTGSEISSMMDQVPMMSSVMPLDSMSLHVSSLPHSSKFANQVDSLPLTPLVLIYVCALLVHRFSGNSELLQQHMSASGSLQQQVILMDMERFDGSLDSGASQMGDSVSGGLANDMRVYAERMENGMNENIQELAEIGASVASLSHCVKNIVNNLKAGSFVVEKGIKNHNHDMVKEGWDMLGKNISRMSDLAMDILTCSKKQKPDSEDCELNKVLEEVVDVSKERAKVQNVMLVKALDPSIGLVHMEQKEIYRSVLNLVSNSIDACNGKGNCVVIVRSSLMKEGKHVRIDVSDTGIGMTEETKNKLFTSFFSTKGSKGTGLGLPTTYKIINEHGGSIEVQSELGKGTTFTIILPIRTRKIGAREIDNHLTLMDSYPIQQHNQVTYNNKTTSAS